MADDVPVALLKSACSSNQRCLLGCRVVLSTTGSFIYTLGLVFALGDCRRKDCTWWLVCLVPYTKSDRREGCLSEHRIGGAVA
jgi:hypothetical protein